MMIVKPEMFETFIEELSFFLIDIPISLHEFIFVGDMLILIPKMSSKWKKEEYPCELTGLFRSSNSNIIEMYEY